MSVSLNLQLKASSVTCYPNECGVNSLVGLKLKSGEEDKSADGSGWLKATVTSRSRYAADSLVWIYTVLIADTELSDEINESLDTLTSDDIVSVCCLGCDAQMALDRLDARQLTNFTSESFRLFEANAVHVNGNYKLLRRHSDLLIQAIDVSVDEHQTGYPYATDPQDVTVSLLKSPAHDTGPLSALTALTVVIDPASATPLTNRRVFTPNLELPGGSALWIGLSSPDPDQHLGLEIHLDYTIPEE